MPVTTRVGSALARLWHGLLAYLVKFGVVGLIGLVIDVVLFNLLRLGVFGATVVASGNFPLVIQCQGAVDVSGTLQLDGSTGAHGFRGDSTASLIAPGGAGGAGGPGGNPGGAGAFATIGAGGNFDGLDGQGLTAGSGGIGGNSGENDGGTSAPSSWLSNSSAIHGLPVIRISAMRYRTWPAGRRVYLRTWPLP